VTLNDELLNKAIQEFDIYQFLDDNNITYKTTGENIGVGWIGIETCINCENSNYHFGININTKTYSCWICKNSGSLVSFVSNIKKIYYKKAMQFILDATNIDSNEEIDNLDKVKNILSKTIEEPEKKEKQKLQLIKGVPIGKTILNNNPIILYFTKEKNLKLKDITEYNFKLIIEGYYKGKLLIPIIHRRRLVGYVIRSFVHSNYIKRGSVNHYLYKTERLRRDRPTIIVEGIFDYINTYKFLEKYYRGRYNVTCTFSKIMTDEQIKLLERYKPKSIIFMLDGDSWHDYYKTKMKLSCDSTFLVLQKDKDPGDLTEKAFLRLFKENNL
jgi:hypothetical protein